MVGLHGEGAGGIFLSPVAILRNFGMSVVVATVGLAPLGQLQPQLWHR